MDKLPISNKLYGRKQDVSKLIELFEHVSNDHGAVLLVPGSSGIGKTSLVHELQMPVRDRNGFFISGKFDQYQQNIPYFAFRQALSELCKELQSIDMQQRSRIKAEILQAIGNLGQVLVDLVPEFEQYFGIQPPLIDVSPQEARHRFAEVLRNFLKVVCRPEHPLVLYIDDWQWADAASFDLLKQIQAGITLRYLLVIVSYRDSEVDSIHPLESTVDYLRRHAVPIEVLKVKNITVENVQRILADTLKPTIIDAEELAAIIHDKTQGNPFFVRLFINFLYEYDLIWLGKDRNTWQWRIDKVGGRNLPSNMIELFALKLRRLDTDSQNLLSLAACLGNSFDLEALSIISGLDSTACLALLFSDQTKELFLPLVSDKGGSLTEDIFVPKICTFLHDQIQQAARSLIEPAELPSILLKIGRLLLTNLRPEQLAERLFEVVNDLNAGNILIQDITEQVKMVELNISAGRKAYAATAYSSALLYYQAAARFLENHKFAEHLWLNYHELAMNLFNELAGCEFLEGDRIFAEQCIQQSVAHSMTALEKANALNMLIVQHTLLAKYHEAIIAGREALAALGISLPEEAYDDARNDEIALVRQKLQSHSVSSLIDLPIMSNPEMLIAAKILITMGPPCYRAHQQLWSVVVPKVVNLTLQYGNIPQVGYSHTAFGGLLGWVDNDYATAKEFGELATCLMARTFQSPPDQSVFYLMIGSSIRHWFKHLRYSTKDYQDAVEVGLRSGNLQYAAYAFGHDMYCQFYQGVPLSILIQQSQQSLAFSQTRINQWAIDLLEGGLHIFGTLSDNDSALNKQDTWSEEKYIQRIEDHQNIQVTCIYSVLKTFSLLVFGNYEDALALSDETEPLIFTVGTQGLLPWPEHVFARLLILTALYSNADRNQQTKWRSELDEIISRLRIWADNCPENFEHKYLLGAAELARIDDRPTEAMQLYDEAIEATKANNFLQWESIANERAYSFWLERKNEQLAHIYWQHAYVCYDRWGAVAKVHSMERAFRANLAKNIPVSEGYGKAGKMQEQTIKHTWVERQIEQLRNYASQTQQIKLQAKAVNYAEELTHAMQRLRLEMAERKKLEQYEQFHSHILEMLANDNRLPSILEAIVLGVEQLNPEMLCSILLLDDQGKHFVNGVAPSLPDFYNAAIDGLEIGAGVGSCGTSAWTGKRVIVENIATHPYWAPYKELAANAGLGACWSQPICASSGKVLGTFAIYHNAQHTPTESDIYLIEQSARLASISIEHASADKALRISEDRFKTIFNDAPIGIALIDSLTGHMYAVNPMFAKIAGRTLEEMADIDWMSITHPDDVQEDLDNMALLNAGKIPGFQMQKRYIHHDGTTAWISMTITPIFVEDKTHPRHLCMIEDITKRKADDEQIQRLAFYDPLTQLPNRRLLLERLKHGINVEQRDGKLLALLMIDLDRFKAVNDSHGHQSGDELLQQVASRITTRLRNVDMVARWGGDEFIVLLEDVVQPEDAARVAKEIIEELTKPFCLSSTDSVQIGASIGISLYPQHGNSPESLMDHADAALYQAKGAGRGCLAYFSEDLTIAAQKHMVLETRLRRAVEKQELIVFFQPQMDIVSGRIIGAEALVRWQDPIEGLIQPLNFIHIAEETNLIVEIGSWVLRETCRQGRQWLDEGLPPLTLAVNVSPHQFQRSDIDVLVALVLKETGFPANQLELEITESGLMGNQNHSTSILNSLRAQGVRLAIDDFGTGYSSLAYLKHFPLDVLKIDKGFIDDIPFHQDDMEIAATIVAMGHTLGFKVLAEGVETPEQLAFLLEKGCDSYQGYIKSKPVSAHEFAELLRKQQRDEL